MNLQVFLPHVGELKKEDNFTFQYVIFGESTVGKTCFVEQFVNKKCNYLSIVSLE